jgi:hypothetical protein
MSGGWSVRLRRMYPPPNEATVPQACPQLTREQERGSRRVGRTYLNGRGERIRADTPSPSLLIPVANIRSYVGRARKTA